MDFQEYLSLRHADGNVHIDIDGRFSSDRARQLSLLLATHYPGSGNIFIHTDRLDEIEPEAPNVFVNWLNVSGVPVDRVYAMGRRGMEMSTDSLRAIVPKKKGHGPHGCGKCKNCTCGTQAKADETGHSVRGADKQEFHETHHQDGRKNER